jgi:hypothetical protein
MGAGAGSAETGGTADPWIGTGTGGATGVSTGAGGRFWATLAAAGWARRIGCEWCVICAMGACALSGRGACRAGGAEVGIAAAGAGTGAAGTGAAATGAGAATALATGSGAGLGRWVNFIITAPPNAPTSTRSPI